MVLPSVKPILVVFLILIPGKLFGTRTTCGVTVWLKKTDSVNQTKNMQENQTTRKKVNIESHDYYKT